MEGNPLSRSGSAQPPPAHDAQSPGFFPRARTTAAASDRGLRRGTATTQPRPTQPRRTHSHAAARSLGPAQPRRRLVVARPCPSQRAASRLRPSHDVADPELCASAGATTPPPRGRQGASSTTDSLLRAAPTCTQRSAPAIARQLEGQRLQATIQGLLLDPQDNLKVVKELRKPRDSMIMFLHCL